MSYDYYVSDERRLELRIERAITQRICVLGQERGDQQITYTVAGVTGVYTVVLGPQPSCSCPDNAHGTRNFCKHLINVLVKVHKVPLDSPLIGSMAWDADDLAELGLDVRPRQLASPRLVEQDAECCICYEALLNGEPLTDCIYGCRKQMHRACVATWRQHKALATCPYCRAAMPP